MTNDDIIKEEIDSILVDLVKLYDKENKRVSSQFAEGLEAVYEKNKGTIRGFTYLAGRGKTKKKGKAGEPTVLEQIKIWVVQKGIAAKVLAKSKAKTAKAKKNLINGLAYVITRKIHTEGTNRENWLKVYEQVITVDRVESIIDRVSELNVNKLVDQIRAELQILSKNV